MTATPPILSFENVRKEFGPVVACRDLCFEVATNSIHAIVGENGAGKSTAMKLLFGLDKPTAGRILLNQQEIRFASPLAAIRAGIEMVHQHFVLAEDLTALENILLRLGDRKPWRSTRAKEQAQVITKMCEQYGLTIPLHKKISDLSVGEQQRVEILQALVHRPKVLILDEPTAVLTPQEVEPFFAQLRELRNQGMTILIITHKLKEVMALADQVSVLRKGSCVLTKAVAQTDIHELAEAMTGKAVEAVTLPEDFTPKSETLLELKSLSSRSSHASIADISFHLRAGEIVGIAGVEGNGQDLLLQTLLEPKTVAGLTGEINLGGQSLKSLSARAIRALGIAALPEDRLRLGLVSEFDARENWLLTHTRYRQARSWGWVRWQKIDLLVEKILQDFSVQPNNLRLPLANFSGGNQQKFVVGRELGDQPKVLIAAHPTRGVDVAAIKDIHSHLLALAQRGSGVLLLSSELDEIMALSHRLLVMFRGRIVAEFDRPQFVEREIGLAMAGQSWGEHR